MHKHDFHLNIISACISICLFILQESYFLFFILVLWGVQDLWTPCKSLLLMVIENEKYKTQNSFIPHIRHGKFVALVIEGFSRFINPFKVSRNTRINIRQRTR